MTPERKKKSENRKEKKSEQKIKKCGFIMVSASFLKI